MAKQCQREIRLPVALFSPFARGFFSVCDSRVRLSRCFRNDICRAETARATQTLCEETVCLAREFGPSIADVDLGHAVSAAMFLVRCLSPDIRIPVDALDERVHRRRDALVVHDCSLSPLHQVVDGVEDVRRRAVGAIHGDEISTPLNEGAINDKRL